MVQVIYLGHSGYLVETDHNICIFDYYRGLIPDLNPEKKISIFVSHIHQDHYNPEIFTWKNRYPNIQFILSDDISIEKPERNILSVSPRKEYWLDEMEIRTLKSTDEGVAFLVKADQKWIYHAGDLNWWHWEEEGRIFNEMMSRKYRSEIDKIKGKSFDIAFVPLDARQGEFFFLGMDYFMRNTDSKIVFPMHLCDDGQIIDRLYQKEESEPYRSRVVRIQTEGQKFLIEGE